MLYFIMSVVNAFVLIRIYKAMFSKTEEIKTNVNSEEEEENLKKFRNYTTERFVCPYFGRLAIKTDGKTTERVPEERVELARQFFGNIGQYEEIAKKNLIVLIIMWSDYVIINLLLLVNIFAMGSSPLTYVYVCWLQHILLGAFWGLVIYCFTKLVLYSNKVKEVIQQFEGNERCKITVHDGVNVVEFNFLDS